MCMDAQRALAQEEPSEPKTGTASMAPRPNHNCGDPARFTAMKEVGGGYSCQCDSWQLPERDIYI